MINTDYALNRPPQKNKPTYRVILEVREKEVLTTKRGGGRKLRPTAYRYFKQGDVCLIENNEALPLLYPRTAAPDILILN